MAALSGLSLESWDDLERYDEEIEECISMEQVVAISNALGVEPWQLLAHEGEHMPPVQISFHQVADIVRDRMARFGFTLEELEHQIGWTLGPFLADPSNAVKNPASFLRDLSTDLGIAWGSVRLE